MTTYLSKTSKLFSALRKCLGTSVSEFPRLNQHWKFFTADYLSYNLGRKLETSLDGAEQDPKALDRKAVADFLQCEQDMLRVNELFETTLVENHAFAATIQVAQRKIAQALGVFRPDEYIDFCSFTTGSSTRLKRKYGNPSFKFSDGMHVTRNALPLAAYVFRELTAVQAYLPTLAFKVVEGSEFFTVPKQHDKRRGASKEPDANLFLQKGLGRMIRTRLKKVGIDLNSQDRNRRLAREGSATGLLATIDLSAASDSISLALLRHLIPEDWLSVILATRSERVVFEGCVPGVPSIELEKVSTMGNGFTFELESLLFWGLTSAIIEIEAAVDRRVGVFGDDIICDVAVIPALLDVFTCCGFTVNQEKSFWSGPFRESCGKHYHSGKDVTPFNVTSVIDSPSELAHFVNRLRRWSMVSNIDLSPVYAYIARLYSEFKPPFVPSYMGTKAGYTLDTFGELQLLGRFKTSKPSSNLGLPYYATQSVQYLGVVQNQDKGPVIGGYLAWLNKAALGTNPEETSYVDRGTGAKYKKRWHRVRWWEDTVEYGMFPPELGGLAFKTA